MTAHAPGIDLVPHGHRRGPRRELDQLANARGAAAAHVVGAGLDRRGRHVGPGRVAHVDEVTRGVGVARADHGLVRAGALGLRHLARDRAHYVVGGLSGPGLVERPQAHHAQAVRGGVLAREQIAGGLGHRVGVLRVERGALVHRQTLRRPVDLAGARAYEGRAGRLTPHGLQQVQGGVEVRAEDLAGLLPRAPDGRLRREVEDHRGCRVRYRAAHGLRVEQVNLGASGGHDLAVERSDHVPPDEAAPARDERRACRHANGRRRS